MKVDQLMDAIEHIDDRFIEESAYGVRRKSHIPWGMIITAACFCLAIGVTIFIQSLGILPHLSGTTPGTSQPVAKPSDGTTVPTTPPEIDPAELETVRELFSDMEGWYRRALIAQFTSPEELPLQSFFRNSTDFGEGLEPTKEEMDELTEWEGYLSASRLVILPANKMNAVLTEIFGITIDEMDGAAFDGMKYVESIDSWCFWRRTKSQVCESPIEHVEKISGDIYRVLYKRSIPNPSLSHVPIKTFEVRIKTDGDNHHILSHMMIEDDNQNNPTEPPETTPKAPDETTAPTTPPEWEKYNELFRKPGSWYNQALTCEYDSPEQLNLRFFFDCGIPGETTATAAEWAQLKDVNGFEDWKDFYRLPVDKMNAVLTEYFGITLDDIDPAGFGGLTYLESTNCYYFMATAPNYIPDFRADNVEEQSDGTICVRYNISYLGDYVVTIKPHGDGYRILSNMLAEENRPYSVDAAQLDALFEEVGNGKVTQSREKEIVLPLLGTFLENPELFLERLEMRLQVGESVIQIINTEVQYPHPRYTAYKNAIQSLLTKVLPEEHKKTVYRMAFYNGLANYLSQTPDATDYALLFDMVLYSDGAFSESCADWMERYCKADPKLFTAAMAQTAEEHWEVYAQWTVMYATQEDRAQIKESMTQLIDELSVLDGYGLYDQIQCAKLIIERCDKPIG